MDFIPLVVNFQPILKKALIFAKLSDEMRLRENVFFF